MADLASARANMVAGQILVNDVQDPKVLEAMGDISRERFLPAADAPLAYADVEVNLPGGQTMLMPVVFAKMLQLADIESSDIVLDIGGCTGYSTAVLAKLASSVVALECDAELADEASEKLAALGVDNAAVVSGPLEKGYTSEAPYDVIFVNGAVETVPADLLAQLAPNGRLVAIVGAGAIGRATIFTSMNGAVAERQAFDAAASLLPGFAATAEFVF